MGHHSKILPWQKSDIRLGLCLGLSLDVVFGASGGDSSSSSGYGDGGVAMLRWTFASKPKSCNGLHFTCKQC